MLDQVLGLCSPMLASTWLRSFVNTGCNLTPWLLREVSNVRCKCECTEYVLYQITHMLQGRTEYVMFYSVCIKTTEPGKTIQTHVIKLDCTLETTNYFWLKNNSADCSTISKGYQALFQNVFLLFYFRFFLEI